MDDYRHPINAVVLLYLLKLLLTHTQVVASILSQALNICCALELPAETL